MTGDANLWYKTCTKKDKNASRPKIKTWDILEREFGDQFFTLISHKSSLLYYS